MFNAPTQDVKPLQITIGGEPGIGKTTLANTFKKPAFIRFEDGTLSLGKHSKHIETPILNTFEDAMKAVKAAASNDDIGSIIIDSISTMELKLEKAIVEGDPKATSIVDAINGYGRGERAVAHQMGEFRAACDNAGKNCIYLCHTVIARHNAVDMPPYNVLSLKLSKHTLPYFVDQVDCVAFMRLKISDQRKGAEKVVVSSLNRELICHAHATIGSKNRLGITKPLECPLGVNPIIEHIKTDMKGE